jgi:hypothetical protein
MELSRVPPAPAPAQVEATLRAVCGAPPDFGVTALRAGAPVGSGPFGPSTEAIVRAADAVAEEAADEMELAEAPPADAALAAVVAVAQPPTAMPTASTEARAGMARTVRRRPPRQLAIDIVSALPTSAA